MTALPDVVRYILSPCVAAHLATPEPIDQALNTDSVCVDHTREATPCCDVFSTCLFEQLASRTDIMASFCLTALLGGSPMTMMLMIMGGGGGCGGGGGGGVVVVVVMGW